MKKILIISFLFFLLFFLSTKNTSAACVQRAPAACNLTTCAAGGTSYCCDTRDQCTTLQDSQKANALDKGATNKTKDISTCDNGSAGIQTAIGCIQVFNQTTFLSNILTWAVGIGGGIAFLLIIYAGFMIMTGAGNPERLKAGQELLTSALSGLILLVLSIFILRFIGIDILQLGKFGFGTTPTP